MTTKTIVKIEQLARDGWCDAEIGRMVGVDTSTARRWRIKAGVEPGKNGRRYPARKYAVYDAKSTEFLVEGTAKEIAEFLGLKRSGMYSTIYRSLRGQLNKYEFCEVTE